MMPGQNYSGTTSYWGNKMKPEEEPITAATRDSRANELHATRAGGGESQVTDAKLKDYLQTGSNVAPGSTPQAGFNDIAGSTNASAAAKRQNIENEYVLNKDNMSQGTMEKYDNYLRNSFNNMNDSGGFRDKTAADLAPGAQAAVQPTDSQYFVKPTAMAQPDPMYDQQQAALGMMRRGGY